MATSKQVLAVLAVTLAFAFASAFSDHHNIAPSKEHSITRPFNDAANPSKQFWKETGSATSNEDYLRLTSTLASQEGQLWNQVPVTTNHWEVSLEFRVSGERFLGGDGFALWYTKEKGVPGTTFGNTEAFQGLGIIFDTYDNDGKRDNPSMTAFLSDGSVRYDHDTDGDLNRLDGAFCRVSYRNTRKPARVKITYKGDENMLSLYYDVKGNNHWMQCFLLHNVHVPVGYYLGLTAHTGDVADNHDIYMLEVRDLGHAPVTPQHAEASAGKEAGESKDEDSEDIDPTADENPDPVQPVHHTDTETLKPYADLAKSWRDMPSEKRAEMITSRREKYEKHKSEQHEEHHEDEHHDGTSSSKVLSYLESIQSTVHDLYSEVEEVSKAVADVNFDINTNVIPNLGKTASPAPAPAEGQTASPAPAPAGASSSLPPTDELQKAVRAGGDHVVLQVSNLLTEQAAKIKTIGVDVAEVKNTINSRLSDKRHEDEMFSKLSLLSNEVIKLKTMVQDLHASRGDNNDQIRSQFKELHSSVQGQSSSSFSSLFGFAVVQLIFMGAYIAYKKRQEQNKMHIL